MKIGIIGAGITGLYLGWKLTEKGEEVTIFEKKNQVGKTPCSGLFSRKILDFIPQAIPLIENQINFVLIHFPKKTLRVKFSHPFYVMDHSKLDQLVANLAQKAGTKIIFNHSNCTLPEGFDRYIGCDGADSFVRKKLNLPEPQFQLGIRGFINKKDFSDYVETWVTPSGFLWKIPRGKESEYGIFEKTNLARNTLGGFLSNKNLKLERVDAALIPQGLIIPKNPNITLCGDAAGLTKPWSGGGVVWSLTAANLLLKYFPDFLKYRNKAKNFFLPKIRSGIWAKKLVYFLGNKMPWILPTNFKIDGDFLWQS